MIQKLKIQSLICAHARAKKLLNMILVKSKDVFLVSKAILSDMRLF